jgi:hypothetical protein
VTVALVRVGVLLDTHEVFILGNFANPDMSRFTDVQDS